ncbi:MAG: 30S ribosomal protein S6, partial [Reyranella sp.]
MALSMRDEPGTQREFETIFILRPDTNQDGIQLVNTRVRTVIDQMGGRLLKLDNWGKRKLAYEVKKQLKGIYLYWQYLGTPGVVEEIERNLRMLDTVIRYYTVKVDE